MYLVEVNIIDDTFFQKVPTIQVWLAVYWISTVSQVRVNNALDRFELNKKTNIWVSLCVSQDFFCKKSSSWLWTDEFDKNFLTIVDVHHSAVKPSKGKNMVEAELRQGVIKMFLIKMSIFILKHHRFKLPIYILSTFEINTRTNKRPF